MIKSDIVCILDRYPVIALAVSGGSDSMALAEWFRLNRSRDSFVIINIDHQIRGEESKQDSEFVQNYAKQHKIKFYGYKVDAVNFSKENGFTLEQGARILRHRIFEKVALEIANVVATAHHMSDQAESVFMHIARGSGMKGLCGMSVEDGHIIRPLINSSKSEIMQFINDNKVEYKEDSTNSDNDYSRNFTRNSVFPLIESKYPAFEKSLLKLSERAKEVADFIDEHTPILMVEDNAVYCDLKGKHKLIKAEMIRRAFSLLGITANIEERHINSIIDFDNSDTTGSIDMPYNSIVYKEENGITISKKIEYEKVSYPFSEGIFEIAGFELIVQKTSSKNDISQKGQSESIGKTLYIAVDNLADLEIRRKSNGDVITKFGGGSKSLGDFLTDKKIPKRLRDRLPVIASKKKIMCVCGVEISAEAKVENNSKDIYLIKLNYEL